MSGKIEFDIDEDTLDAHVSSVVRHKGMEAESVKFRKPNSSLEDARSAISDRVKQSVAAVNENPVVDETMLASADVSLVVEPCVPEAVAFLLRSEPKARILIVDVNATCVGLTREALQPTIKPIDIGVVLPSGVERPEARVILTEGAVALQMMTSTMSVGPYTHVILLRLFQQQLPSLLCVREMRNIITAAAADSRPKLILSGFPGLDAATKYFPNLNVVNVTQAKKYTKLEFIDEDCAAAASRRDVSIPKVPKSSIPHKQHCNNAAMIATSIITHLQDIPSDAPTLVMVYSGETRVSDELKKKGIHTATSVPDLQNLPEKGLRVLEISSYAPSVRPQLIIDMGTVQRPYCSTENDAIIPAWRCEWASQLEVLMRRSATEIYTCAYISLFPMSQISSDYADSTVPPTALQQLLSVLRCGITNFDDLPIAMERRKKQYLLSVLAENGYITSPQAPQLTFLGEIASRLRCIHFQGIHLVIIGSALGIPYASAFLAATLKEKWKFSDGEMAVSACGKESSSLPIANALCVLNALVNNNSSSDALASVERNYQEVLTEMSDYCFIEMNKPWSAVQQEITKHANVLQALIASSYMSLAFRLTSATNGEFLFIKTARKPEHMKSSLDLQPDNIVVPTFVKSDSIKALAFNGSLLSNEAFNSILCVLRPVLCVDNLKLSTTVNFRPRYYVAGESDIQRLCELREAICTCLGFLKLKHLLPNAGDEEDQARAFALAVRAVQRDFNYSGHRKQTLSTLSELLSDLYVTEVLKAPTNTTFVTLSPSDIGVATGVPPVPKDIALAQSLFNPPEAAATTTPVAPNTTQDKVSAPTTTTEKEEASAVPVAEADEDDVDWFEKNGPLPDSDED